MNPAWKHLALEVFDTEDSDQLSIEEIDAAIARYPYFPVLHYLRAGKLIAEGHPAAGESMAKTALYFPNPHWLNEQWASGGGIAGHPAEGLAEQMITPGDPMVRGAEWVDSGHVEVQEAIENDFDNRRMYEEPGAEISGDLVAAEPSEAEMENVPYQKDTVEPEGITGDDVIPMVEVVELAELAHAINSEPAEGQSDPPSEAEAVVPIEPLYTIDYFASQGIKLQVEDLPNDQLSVKLKSFTEWLKSMKRIHPEKIERQIDQETEKQIRQTAEHSNENSEVHTEALAEVYRKQGLDDKAVEVYKKLSLLDPAKSAYFAARIREIKEI